MPVRRLMLLAIGLFALLWTATARPESVPPDGITAMLAAGSSLVTGESHRTHDSDRQWRAQRDSIAAVTESVWKSAPVHAALAATRLARVFDPASRPVRTLRHFVQRRPTSATRLF